MGWFKDNFGTKNVGFTYKGPTEVKVNPDYIEVLKRVGVWGKGWAPEHLNSMGASLLNQQETLPGPLAPPKDLVGFTPGGGNPGYWGEGAGTYTPGGKDHTPTVKYFTDPTLQNEIIQPEISGPAEGGWDRTDHGWTIPFLPGGFTYGPK